MASSLDSPDLQASPEPQPSAPDVIPSPDFKQIKIFVPEFDGNPNDFKDFEMKLWTLFRFFPDVFQKEEAKIAAAAFRLTHTALQWFNSAFQANDRCIRTFDSLILKLGSLFGKQNTTRNARNELLYIKQGSDSVVQ
jgi:hypothetical protein